MQSDQQSRRATPLWHSRFVAMLPQIHAFARRAFRKCHHELKDELVAAVVADCFLAYGRLVELDREADAHPTTLASFSVRRIGSGILVGSPRNRYDIGSRHCEMQTGVRVDRLHWREHDNQWRELLVEDNRRGTPAEVACLRIDIESWLRSLSSRDGAIAQLLGLGESTRDVAQKFGLSSGRVSQLRRTLAKRWAEFHGFDTTEREFAWLGQCAGV